MKLIDWTAIRKCEPSHTLARDDAPVREFLNVLPNDVTRRGEAFHLVIEIDNTRVEWDHMAHLVDENLERVLDVERRAKRAGNLVQRINLAMRFLDLIVSDERSAFACLDHVDVAELQRRFV